MLVTKQLDTIGLDSIYFLHTMEVNGVHKLFGYQHFFSKYLLLCSTQERNSEVWNNLRESK